MKNMKVNKIKMMTLYVATSCLYGCEIELGELLCEQEVNMTCQNYIKCENSRNINTWHFQQTWFVKPERNQKHFGAIFGNETGKFWHPGIERDGNYCIDNRTIVFKNDVPNSPIERIEIIKLIDGEMILKFENGEEFTYYNPESKTKISPKVLEILKRSKPIKDTE